MSTEEHRRKSFSILRSILANGLLCTPEEFDLYPDAETERPRKQARLSSGLPHATFLHSRACFTLMEPRSLSQQCRAAGQAGALVSHADCFGEFAIGIDVKDAQALGIMPAFYFYRGRPMEIGGESSSISGLASQLVSRLEELRDIMLVLASIENRAEVPTSVLDLPLEILGPGLEDEEVVRGRLCAMSKSEAKRIFRLFDTDRVAAWGMVEAVNILLALHQTVGSSGERDPLAYFKEREWRLVRHWRRGMEWYAVGEHLGAMDPYRERYLRNRKVLRESLLAVYDKRMLQECWVLAKIDGLDFRDYIREIIAPEESVDEVRALVRESPFLNPPQVRVLSPRWRLSGDCVPVIECAAPSPHVSPSVALTVEG